MNWIDLIFIYFTLTVVVFAIFINVSESNISPIFLQTFRYGKHAYKGKPSRFVEAFEVPKSYFKHFYVFAIIWAILIFGLMFNVYILGTSVPGWIIDVLDLLCGSDRTVSGMINIFFSNKYGNVHQFECKFATFFTCMKCVERLPCFSFRTWVFAHFIHELTHGTICTQWLLFWFFLTSSFVCQQNVKIKY